jgi:hypothetical protein
MQLRKSASGPESERSGNGQRGRQTRVTQSGPPAGVPLSGLNPFGVSRQLGSQPREDLNHNHAVATARTRTRQHTWRVRREIRLLCWSTGGGVTSSSARTIAMFLLRSALGKSPS